MKLYEPLIKNKETEEKVKLSEQAFSHYLQGEFKQAETLYKRVNDTYSATMLERIAMFITTPPPSFDGTWSWDEK
jgi:hypothetical protein